MPELPEVESVRRALSARIAGRRVEEVRLLRAEVIAHPAAAEFSCRLRGLRLDGQGVFRSADAVLQSHERAHETLLVGLHVDAVHPGGRLSVGEDDGSVAAGAEEGVVRREELRRDEIMDEPLRIGLRKFLKVAEQFHVGGRDCFFEDGAQPHAYENVGGQDGYDGALLHHSWW